MNKKIKNLKKVIKLLIILAIGVFLQAIISSVFNLIYKFYEGRFHGDMTMIGFVLIYFTDFYGFLLFIYLLIKKYNYKIWFFPFLNSLAFILFPILFTKDQNYSVNYQYTKAVVLLIGIILLLRIRQISQIKK